MASISRLKGLLLDLDGVLYVGDRPLLGAVEAVRDLRRREMPLRFLTNTTTRHRRSIVAKLAGMGLEAEESEVLTAATAAASLLVTEGSPRCHLVVRDEVKEEFAGLPVDDEQPEVVVIGDIGAAWTYEVMDRLFRFVMDGARMVALHRGRYWQTERGLTLDIGAFVVGLEYATGREALVAGKPAPAFFLAGLRGLGLAADRVAMVGDDVVSDVGGAQACGIMGVLVGTGKARETEVARSGVEPDLVVGSLGELVGYL